MVGLPSVAVVDATVSKKLLAPAHNLVASIELGYYNAPDVDKISITLTLDCWGGVRFNHKPGTSDNPVCCRDAATNKTVTTRGQGTQAIWPPHRRRNWLISGNREQKPDVAPLVWHGLMLGEPLRPFLQPPRRNVGLFHSF
jgi:hypothetical protein